MPVEVRAEDVNTFSASGTQPLLGLFRLSHDYLAGRRQADAARAQVDVTAAALRERVETDYLRYFEALAQEGIARASEDELNHQAEIARAKLKAGVITRADHLRVEVAAANARQQALSARTQGRAALARLMSAIGLPADGAGVEMVEPRALLGEPAAAPGAFERVWQSALSRRPELVQVEQQAEVQAHARGSRFWALFPEIGLEAAYLRADGQIFLPLNSGFIGVRASWAVWEWGASYYAYRAARAQAESARLLVEEQRRQIGAEVAVALSQAEEAAHSVTVAQQAIEGAEEAYRETDAQVKAGTATTTDLIVAEAALTQARLNLAQARYERAVARVHLRRVTGD
jgi:outer membrane protein TolC